MLHPLRDLLLFLVLVAALVVFWYMLVRAGATKLLKRRPPDPPDPPSNYGLAFEEVHFTSRDDVKLFGWWIPADNAIGTIVLCHGQNGSMDGDTKQAVPLHEAGFNVFMFDFRAHGRSEGEYVTMGMYEKEDLLGVMDYLDTERGIVDVGVLGFSMGAATTLITAALSDHICAIVSDSSFGRLKLTLRAALNQRGVPMFFARPYVDGIIAAASWRTEGRIDQTDPIRWTVHIGVRPILFIQGEEDCYVSIADLDRMASLAKGPVEFWIVEGVGHRGAYAADPVEYNRRVINWFKRYLPKPTPVAAQVESEQV